MTTAKEAYDIASELLKTQTRKQTMNYIGEWNTLLCYLGDLVLEEKKK